MNSNVPWKERVQMECDACKAERVSRCRLIRCMPNVQLDKDEYIEVPCAVPNNDMRYEINKVRAMRFAETRGVQLLWCAAKDTVTIDALREDASLPTKK